MPKWLLMASILLAASNGSAAGGWVIERDDRGDSPLLKDRKSIALTPEEQEQQTLTAVYIKALEAEQANIRAQWPNPEVSGSSRWVVYSQDYRLKKVLDFENNRFEISLDGLYQGGRLDFAAMSKAVRSQLAMTLATSVQQALDQDPIQSSVNQAFAELGQPQTKADSNTHLVLKELFTAENPSDSDIRKKAHDLMRNASIRYQAQTASLAAVTVNMGKKMTYVVPLPDNRIRKKVIEYHPLVSKQAERFSLSEDVILAIMHTESHFNPLARSHIPAFGLMQIVPSTAGRDAARKLYSKPKLLSAQYLYNPEKNIEVGAAYLNVLYYKYLKDIKDPQSRLYYTIAAYNAGASNVARAFIGRASFKEALVTINSLSADEVLEALVTRAPQLETRQYLQKVLKRRLMYAKL